MKKQQFFNLVLAFLWIACGCTKDAIQDDLPPVTQIGANTFACIYDNQVFVPGRSSPEGFGSMGGSVSGLSITGHHSDTEHSSTGINGTYGNSTNLWFVNIYIYKLPSIGVGTYVLDKGGEWSPYHSHIYMRARSPKTGEWEYYSSYKNSGEIKITRKDDDNVIFSGTFSGKLKNEAGTEIVEITQGRFDLNKMTYHNNQ